MSKKQIGGSHYKSFTIEPWTFIQENQLNPFQANVIRYTCRYKNKGDRFYEEKRKEGRAS